MIPLKGVDATHLCGLGQNYPLGKLYTFIALDGNGMIHEAVGHGGNESGPEWTFFLQFFMFFYSLLIVI